MFSLFYVALFNVALFIAALFTVELSNAAHVYVELYYVPLF